MKSLYQKKGGGEIGYCWFFSWQASWPFSKLQIYTDKVVLSVWPFTSILKLKDIDSISKKFGVRIKMNHHGPNMHHLVFSSFDSDEVVDAFKKIKVKLKR